MIDLKHGGEINTQYAKGLTCAYGVPFDGAVSCGKGTALARDDQKPLPLPTPNN